VWQAYAEAGELWDSRVWRADALQQSSGARSTHSHSTGASASSRKSPASDGGTTRMDEGESGGFGAREGGVVDAPRTVWLP